VLSLAHVSTLYRYAVLAKALKLRIPDLLALKTLSGLNPFATPEQTIAFAIEQTIAFVMVVDKVKQSGFTVAQLNYLYRHLTAPPANFAPQPTTLLLLAKTLRDSLTQIAQDNTLAPDPTGDLMRVKLALLFDSATVDQTIRLINGSAVYVAPLATLPSGIVFPDLVKNKVTYDQSVKVLRFQGAMTTAEQSALLGASADQAYQTAVNNLFQQPLTFIQNTLSGFLDVMEGQNALVQNTSSLDQALKQDATAIASKFTYLLGKLLPYLITRLSHALAKQTIADALKLDGGMAQLLLESQMGQNQAPIAALLALATPGLTASYFTSNDLTGEPTARTDPAVAFDGSDTTPDKMIPAATQSARWTGMLLAPNNGDFTFTVRADGTAHLWLGDDPCLTFDSATNECISPPVPLKAGQLYDLRLEVTAITAPTPPHSTIVELCWQSATVPKAIIPATNLYPGAEFDAFAKTFTRLQKAALIINNLKLTVDEVAYLSTPSSGFGFDLNALPLSRDPGSEEQIDQAVPALFAGWQRVNEPVRLRNSLPQGEISLVDVFAAASLDDARAKLAQATGWDPQIIAALTGTDGFNLSQADFKNEIALLQLQDSVRLIKRLGVSPQQLFAWADLGSGRPLDQKFTRDADNAQDIKKAVKAKYDEATWLAIAKPLNDKLRESQRDALVAYLLPRMNLTDANELFEFFLIDPQMSACMETSRIKQAISSVQLFVQRCLMNLENDVSPSAIVAEQWEWRKHYRVWEANRKVFLWPENWTESELRDDKSPFCKELESELLQNDLTTDTAETAFLNYLEKLDQVARLEVVGMYCQLTFRANDREKIRIEISSWDEPKDHSNPRTRRRYTGHHRAAQEDARGRIVGPPLPD
jgi:hypothetical protein